jgi:hypothetical protein
LRAKQYRQKSWNGLFPIHLSHSIQWCTVTYTVEKTLLNKLRQINNKGISYSKKSYPCNRAWRPIGLWDVEAPIFSRDSQLTDGGKVVSLMHRPPFTPQEDSWYSFC